MLIEYKIKFEKDGVTITQRVEPDVSGATPVKAAASGTATIAGSLGNSFVAGKGGGGGDPTDTGSGGPNGAAVGMVPIIVLGPIIMGCSSPTNATTVQPANGANAAGANDVTSSKAAAN